MPHALIIGGGISGLTTALALVSLTHEALIYHRAGFPQKAKGWTSDIFESNVTWVTDDPTAAELGEEVIMVHEKECTSADGFLCRV